VRYAPIVHGDDWCFDVELTRDGRLLATAGISAQVWDLATGKAVSVPLQLSDWTFQATFSPDAEARLLLTSCKDQQARLWDWRSGKLACPPMDFESSGHSAVFSPDGRWIYTTGKTVRAWDSRTGKPVTPPESLRDDGAVLIPTPDGQHLLVKCPRSVRVLNQRTLLAPVLPDINLDDLRLWGEIVSAQRVEEGGGVVKLGLDEWLERWRTWRKAHPSVGRPIRFSVKEQVAWQRLQVDSAIAEERWSAASWHLEQLRVQLTDKERLAWHRAEAESAIGEEIRIWHLQRFVELAPKTWWAWSRLGLAHRKLKQWESAYKALSRAIELEPRHAELWLDRARLYEDMREPAEKIHADLTRFQALKQNVPVAWKWRAELNLDRLKNYGEAISDFTKLIELTPLDIDSRVWHAFALLGADDFAGYQKACASLVQDFGSTEEPAVTISVAWTCCLAPQGLTDYAPVVALAENTAKRVKTYPALRALSAAWYRTGKHRAALERLQEATAVQPQLPSCWCLLAMAHHRAGQTEVAGKWLRKAEQWLEQARKEAPAVGAEPKTSAWLRLPWAKRLALSRLREVATQLLREQNRANPAN